MGQFDPHNSLAICCPYDTVILGFGNLSDFASVVEYFTYGNKYRIRQRGSIRRIKLYVAAAVSTLKVRIWRQVGTKFDLVATSEELAGSAVAGQINTFDLATPLAVEEGDFYSVQVRGTGGATPVSCLHAKTGQTGVTVYLRIGGASPTTQFDWLIQDPVAGAANPVELYSQSPSFVFIGDSIIAGFPDHQSYLHTAFSHSPGTTIETQFGELTGFSYQNMGVGGNRADQVLARLSADCIALHPRAAVILVGVNDVSQGRTLSQYTSDYTSILSALVSAGIVPVPLATLPWSNGSNAQAQQIEDFNAALRTVVASFPTARLIDARSRVGQARAGGPPGNLWDMAAAYNSDGVHWNAEGHRQLALALRDELTLTPGPYLMVASRVVTSIIDNQAPYVQKNGTATFLARVVSWDGLPIRQVDVDDARYTVSLLDPNNPDQEAAISGHEEVSIAVESSVYDAPRLDAHWTHDPWGYNFRHTIDVTAAPAFAMRGRRHLVRFTLVPAAIGNQPVHLDFPVFVR